MITIISLPDLLCHVKWFKFICPTTVELSFKVTEHSILSKDPGYFFKALPVKKKKNKNRAPLGSDNNTEYKA